MAEQGWSRPAGAPAKIYARENGVVIRDVTPDLDNFVIEFMLEYFARDEPLNRSVQLTEDPDSLADLITIWNDVLPRRVSLVALAEGSPGSNLEPVSLSNPPTIMGANVLTVNCKSDKKSTFLSQFSGAAFKKVGSLLSQISSLENIFERYGVDHYLDAVGLSVAPISRGKGIGLMLLKARIDLCRDLKIPLTKTIFTAIQSQKLAAKVGFEVLQDKDYDEFKGPDGKVLFPDMAPTKSIQLSVRTIP
ncbi:uncharacterized protein LOC132192614 [Neocloeon triangulifer]|uniref:uncharacterized protein LOC132192614 n=1 Tax=Neocloeon triangulifer TaxID=2078957 RepID=UPI00286F727A|nr:uncharacterized protein LOC132192614 [Neocloeon triangulifer]